MDAFSAPNILWNVYSGLDFKTGIIHEDTTREMSRLFFKLYFYVPKSK